MNSSLTRKLESALTALTGPGALKDRLLQAYCDCLETIDEQDLPGEVREEFAAMSTALHRVRALPGDSVVRASIRKLSNEEAQRFAALVIRAYGLRLAGLTAAAKPTLRSTTRATTPLAAFLASENSGLAAAASTKMASRA